MCGACAACFAVRLAIYGGLFRGSRAFALARNLLLRVAFAALVLVLNVGADPRPATMFTVILVLVMLANLLAPTPDARELAHAVLAQARALACFAGVFPVAVLANTLAFALLASVALAPVFAHRNAVASVTMLFRAPVWADAGAAALFTVVFLLPMDTQRSATTLLTATLVLPMYTEPRAAAVLTESFRFPVFALAGGRARLLHGLRRGGLHRHALEHFQVEVQRHRIDGFSGDGGGFFCEGIRHL